VSPKTVRRRSAGAPAPGQRIQAIALMGRRPQRAGQAVWACRTADLRWRATQRKRPLGGLAHRWCAPALSLAPTIRPKQHPQERLAGARSLVSRPVEPLLAAAQPLRRWCGVRKDPPRPTRCVPLRTLLLQAGRQQGVRVLKRPAARLAGTRSWVRCVSVELAWRPRWLSAQRGAAGWLRRRTPGGWCSKPLGCGGQARGWCAVPQPAPGLRGRLLELRHPAADAAGDGARPSLPA